MEPLKVENRAIGDLVPYANNARTHSDKQIAQIAAAIKRWGFTTPLLVDDKGTIIAGHGRYAAAKLLGMDTVPVIVRGQNWSDEDKRAYILADNQLALNAGWDEDLRRIEVTELAKLGFDMDLIGFSDPTLKKLLDQNSQSAAAVLGTQLVYQVIVVAKDEAEQAALLAKFEKEGLDCRPLIS